MNITFLPGLILLGWAAGSLMNYLGDVLPETRRLTRPVCLKCKAVLGPGVYLPMRACQQCGKRRSARAWTIQALGVAATVALAAFPLGRMGFWAGLLVLLYFGVVSIIDIEHRIIMHPVSLFGAALSLAIGTWQRGLIPTLIGGAAGFGSMLLVYYFGFLFAKWLAKRRKVENDEEAFGFGDVALSGVLGLLMGWPGIAGGLVLAILLGGAGSLVVVLSALATRKYHAFMAIPYGPFLILAAAILLFRPLG